MFFKLNDVYYQMSSIKSVACSAKSSNEPGSATVAVIFSDGSSLVETFSDARSAIHRLWDIVNPGWDD